MTRVLVADLAVPEYLVRQMRSDLQDHAIVEAVVTREEDELLERGRDADVLVVAVRPLSAAQLAQMPHARLVHALGAGYDNLDVSGIGSLGIALAYNPGFNLISVAEHTIMLILAVLRNFGAIEQSARDGEFATGRFLATPGPELHGSAVGLLGFGHVGQAVAERLLPFGARVAYTARHRVDAAIEEHLGVDYATFDELLEASTILSMHLPLSDATRGLIGENELRRMPVGSFLVNTSRGGIINEEALRKALESGHLAGVALDVLERETGAGNPFADLPQVLVTPHLAGSSQKSFPRAGQMCAANIVRFLNGEKLVNQIPLKTVPNH